MLKRVPAALRNPFWAEFIETIEEEFLRLKAAIEIKNTLYDIQTADYTRLLELSALLGVLFNAGVDESIEFLRREVEAIPFKILNKSTIKLYKSFFKALNRDGEIFIYFFKTSSAALVRNSKNILVGIATHDPLLPYKHESTGEFTGFVEDAVRLDQSPIQILDIEDEEGNVWTLDTVDTEISTNHIALEYFIDRIITKDVQDENGNFVPKEFLMTWEFMDFITVNTEFSRRAKEVPHVGSQLAAITDNSGYFNPVDDDYTMPAIKMKTVTNPVVVNQLSSVFDTTFVEFGIGVNENLPSKFGGGQFPDRLNLRVARNFILADEKWETADWFAVSAEYKGQEINTFVVHDSTGYLLDNDPDAFGFVDGVNNDFSGTLPFAPLQKRNIRFDYTTNDLNVFFIDDGNGNLIGDTVYGTIDYNTGKYEFSSDIDFRDSEILFVGDGTTTSVNITLASEKTPILSSIANPRVSLRYNLENRWFLIFDDGDGNFIADNIVSGTIDYITGEIDLEFENPLTEGEELVLNFQYNKISTPDEGTSILSNFYFTIQRIEITEAALYDNENRILAYATFPPIEFNTSDHHVNFDFIINKNRFVPPEPATMTTEEGDVLITEDEEELTVLV